MAIVGDHPETGVRFVLERGASASPPWRYEGNAFTKDEAFPIVAIVDAAGQVEASGGPSAATPPDLLEKARLVVRALARAAVAEEGAPPRRIVRWRGEK